MTRVLIVATSAVVRAGLGTILTGPAVEVAGSAASLEELPQAIERLAPDVVLIDLERGTLPVLTSAAAAGGPAFLALLSTVDGSAAGEAIRQGIRGVLARDASSEEISAAVTAVGAGLLVLPPAAIGLLPSVQATSTVPVEHLTPREIEVLGMLAEGAGNKQIARRLGISEHTVKFHVGSILGKLGAATRTEAVTIGVRSGLIMV